MIDWLLTLMPTANISAHTHTMREKAALTYNTTNYISKAQIWCLKNICLRQVWCSCLSGVKAVTAVTSGSVFWCSQRGYCKHWL